MILDTLAVILFSVCMAFGVYSFRKFYIKLWSH